MPKVRARRGGKPKTSKITLAPTSINKPTETTNVSKHQDHTPDGSKQAQHR